MNPGYGFVPLPDRIESRRRDEAVHDRRVSGTLSGVLELTFVAEQPVHIGAGTRRHDSDGIVREGSLVRGLPGIPGSTMKGVLRARYEAITRSCAIVGLDARRSRYKIRSSTGVEAAQLAPSVRQSRALQRCDGWCPACALFGRMSLRSRVTVMDFIADRVFIRGSMPEQFGPNLHHIGKVRRVTNEREDLFEVHALHGRKFAVSPGPVAEKTSRQPVECIPPGSTLRGRLILINATPAELGGLLVALGVRPGSALKVGGGKCHGFGRIRCTNIRFDPRDTETPTTSDDEWHRDFSASPDRFEAGMNALVALHTGDC